MKPHPIPLIITLTVLLLVLGLFSAIKVSFPWIFRLTILGEIVFIYTVYRVLADTYATTKSFDDFYEDHPIREEEKKL